MNRRGFLGALFALPLAPIVEKILPEELKWPFSKAEYKWVQEPMEILIDERLLKAEEELIGSLNEKLYGDSSFSDMVTTTLRNNSHKLYDNVYKSNGLLALLTKKQQRELKDEIRDNEDIS